MLVEMRRRMMETTIHYTRNNHMPWVLIQLPCRLRAERSPPDGAVSAARIIIIIMQLCSPQAN